MNQFYHTSFFHIFRKHLWVGNYIFDTERLVLLSLLRGELRTSKLTVSFSQYPASGSFFVSVLIFNFTDGAAFKTQSIFKVIASGSGQKASSHAFVRGWPLKRNWPFCPWTHIFFESFYAHHSATLLFWHWIALQIVQIVRLLCPFHVSLPAHHVSEGVYHAFIPVAFSHICFTCLTLKASEFILLRSTGSVMWPERLAAPRHVGSS